MLRQSVCPSCLYGFRTKAALLGRKTCTSPFLALAVLFPFPLHPEVILLAQALRRSLHVTPMEGRLWLAGAAVHTRKSGQKSDQHGCTAIQRPHAWSGSLEYLTCGGIPSTITRALHLHAARVCWSAFAPETALVGWMCPVRWLPPNPCSGSAVERSASLHCLSRADFFRRQPQPLMPCKAQTAPCGGNLREGHQLLTCPAMAAVREKGKATGVIVDEVCPPLGA